MKILSIAIKIKANLYRQTEIHAYWTMFKFQKNTLFYICFPDNIQKIFFSIKKNVKILLFLYYLSAFFAKYLHVCVTIIF